MDYIIFWEWCDNVSHIAIYIDISFLNIHEYLVHTATPVVVVVVFNASVDAHASNLFMRINQNWWKPFSCFFSHWTKFKITFIQIVLVVLNLFSSNIQLHYYSSPMWAILLLLLRWNVYNLDLQTISLSSWLWSYSCNDSCAKFGFSCYCFDWHFFSVFVFFLLYVQFGVHVRHHRWEAIHHRTLPCFIRVRTILRNNI